MKEFKAVILSSDAHEYRDILLAEALPGLSIEICRDVEQAEPHLADCDIMFGTPALVSPLISRAPRLKWVQSMWAGITPFLVPGMRRDYILTGVKEVFGPMMAEYVICHMLIHERRFLHRFQSQLVKQWDTTPPGTLMGKYVGIMGIGSIGRAIAGAAKFFGMKTRGFSRTQTQCKNIDCCYLFRELTSFVKGLDYLVCVLPETADTTGLIDDALLQAMPDTALIINVGRGNVIHEPSLIRALENGNIAGAVLDVFQEEPLPPDHGFWETPNTLITSHTAALSFPGEIAPIFVENYQRFINHEALMYQIDFEHGY
ncbi:Phosphoglycerate dehydrogenase [Desulfocicer vacuolatum DSM 3385]|uniref:Phosphoglycerate dehydrogenase n=1 Tax=Desulfocicer vacuolatum DSM 3385 TaxID=1121400 RepID=A0A1W2DP53_9BACT|nr:D-2-hydroxyacid dehydrogenase [Desulfocicer vacuolatum]SMC99315.1 Phosphoglycerate dehydrogenase [Desulfocicer vacuolatum DSM 3385]